MVFLSSIPSRAAVRVSGERVIFTHVAPDARSVLIRGSWNQWGKPIACIRDATGRWGGMVRLREGTYQYVLVINDQTRIADPENPRTAMDAEGATVSVVVVGSGAPATVPAPAPIPVPQPAASAPPAQPAASDGVVFTVDAPGANLVEVMGSWNGWSQPTVATKGSDGKWKATIKLPAGDYTFKYRKDGDWDALNKDDRKLNVAANGKATFSGATAPAAAVPDAAPVGPLPPTPPGTDFSATPAVVTQDERILFGYSDPFVGKVAIAGEFNGWDKNKNPMTRSADGIWRAVMTIKEGRYKWKFVSDDQFEQGDDRKLTIVRGKGGRLEVLAAQPTFNTPYNSRIFFSGRLFGKAVYREVPEGEQFDTGRLRFAPTEFNFRPKLSFTAGDKVDGFMEAEINRLEDRFSSQFSEGRVTLTEDWGNLFVFRRTRAIDFNNPLRSLDRFGNTLDDNLYFTGEERPPENWFGKEFDVVRRNAGDNDYNYAYGGWQGVASTANLGRFQFQFLGADHVLREDDIWGFRSTWTGSFLRLGSTFVHHEMPRGLQAERVPGIGMSVQNSAFLDTDGGYFRVPGTATNNFDINALIFNFDGLAFFEPNGRNREQWLSSDLRLGHDTRNLFFELQGHRKDYSFVAFENGDGFRPDGSLTFYDDGFSKNFGEYLAGGRGDYLTALVGGLFHFSPRMAVELNYKFEDGNEKTMDRFRNVVDVQPSGGTFTGRFRYKTDKFFYSFEGVHRTVQDFPNTVLQAKFDNYDFSDVSVIGVDNQLQFKQDIAVKLGKWGFTGGHRFRRYDLLGMSPLETNELKGVLTYDLTRRLGVALSGRTKSYSLPNSTAVTTFPNRPQRFNSGGIRALYSISQYVKINAGFGVNFQNDEDLEEGALFFLREGLARARRGSNAVAGPITRTMDQVLYAEDILAKERRFELNLDARF
ncbi:MAG: hypothetical protein AAB229_06220 [Candidatus Hydrogenedentota bacterium]